MNRYDAEGLRHELAEKTDDSIIRLIRGYDLTASEADHARTYYHYASDEMVSITHVVEDAGIKNRYEYDAWGNLTVCEEQVENRFKFNGSCKGDGTECMGV